MPPIRRTSIVTPSLAKRNTGPVIAGSLARRTAATPAAAARKAQKQAEEEEEEQKGEEEEEEEEQTSSSNKASGKGKKSGGKSGGKAADPDEEEDKDEYAKSAVQKDRKRLGDLRKAFPNDSDFALEAYEEGWSVTKAKAEYLDRLQAAQQSQANQRGAKAAAGAAVDNKSEGKPQFSGLQMAGAVSGANGSTSYEGETGDPVADFNVAVRDKMSSLKIPRGKAVAAVCKENPELHQAYLEATNPHRKQRDLIADRFEMLKA